MKKRIIARLFIKLEARAEFKTQAAVMVETTHKEKGCIFYRLFEDVANPGEFMFYEEYADQAALELHSNSAYLSNFRKVTAAMHTKKPVVEVI